MPANIYIETKDIIGIKDIFQAFNFSDRIDFSIQRNVNSCDGTYYYWLLLKASRHDVLARFFFNLNMFTKFDMDVDEYYTSISKDGLDLTLNNINHSEIIKIIVDNNKGNLTFKNTSCELKQPPDQINHFPGIKFESVVALNTKKFCEIYKEYIEYNKDNENDLVEFECNPSEFTVMYNNVADSKKTLANYDNIEMNNLPLLKCGKASKKGRTYPSIKCRIRLSNLSYFNNFDKLCENMKLHMCNTSIMLTYNVGFGDMKVYLDCSI